MASPERSPTARKGELRLLAAAGLAALTIAAGCGSDGEPDSAPAGDDGTGQVVDISESGVVGEILGSSAASLVECRDWNGADEGERLATIEDVRSQQHPEEPGIDEPALSDEEAAELFDNACSPSYAQGFRLYKLYARAAGFIPLKRAIEAEQAAEADE